VRGLGFLRRPALSCIGIQCINIQVTKLFLNNQNIIKQEIKQAEITPVVVYDNADLLKLQAVSANKGKSGVYR
jgi:hypothetical protein